ncbi:MAG: aminotransferase class IV, partial [Planctomycetota bacterium]
MDNTLFSLNGRIVTAREAVVPVTDRGFLYGDGVFETLHAYGRKLFRLRAHLKRLAHGAAHLFFDPAPDLRVLAKWLQAAVDAAGFPEASARLTLSRGAGPRGPSISAQLRPTVVIMVTRHFRAPEEKGAVAVLAGFRRQESAV